MSDSWGNIVRSNQQRVEQHWRTDAIHCSATKSALPVGARRSYGDVCVNDDGCVIDTLNMRRFIQFDRQTGVLRCDAGVSLMAVAQLVVPHNWFLPVTPGTSYATIGGAVANDVHGKNHHIAGSFGCHIRKLALLRRDGQRLICSPTQNPQVFAATIGGLGLTGLITWVEFSLTTVSSTRLLVESECFEGTSQFAKLSSAAHTTHEYCVSWIDCSARASSALQGVFFRANHVPASIDEACNFDAPSAITVPAVVGQLYPLVNRYSVTAFNTLYRWKHRGNQSFEQSMFKYFYPLDSLNHWNRIYGRHGFYQFQCVVPLTQHAALNDILNCVKRAREGSFLSVLKTMGTRQSPGTLSFSRPGITLAMDFPNRGNSTVELYRRLEAIVIDCGGAIYPAKDALMSAAGFRQFFPHWESMLPSMDSGISSSFWRRVTTES